MAHMVALLGACQFGASGDRSAAVHPGYSRSVHRGRGLATTAVGLWDGSPETLNVILCLWYTLEDRHVGGGGDKI